MGVLHDGYRQETAFRTGKSKLLVAAEILIDFKRDS